LSAPILPFVQLDLTSRYGLEPGRYPVRPPGEPASEPVGVLIVDPLDAPIGRQRRRRGRAKPSQADAAAPSVEISRVTVAWATPFADETEAGAWLAAVEKDDEALAAQLTDGLRVINRALHAQRVAAQDSHVPDVSAERALAVRVGYGSGDALAQGDWTQALEVPPSTRRERRVDALRPQERVAKELGGHDSVPPHESHLLRARGDLEAGRLREAAVELDAGVRALLKAPRRQGLEEDADLGSIEGESAALARSANGNSMKEGDLERILLVAERIVRRRRILGS
jgi:hypothetical protein